MTGTGGQGPARGARLESMVLERLAVPEEAHEFGQFEELSRLYALEPPFVARSQIELQFDVYDGRKLRPSAGYLLDEELDSDGLAAPYERTGKAPVGHAPGARGPPPRPKVSLGAARQRARRPKGLSWCRLLLSRGQLRARCCLANSDTNQELGLVSVSTSGQTIGRPLAPGSADAIQAALAASPDDDPDEAELKAEAWRVVSVALAAGGPQAEPGDALGPPDAALSAGTDHWAAPVSVCLLDKRHLPRRVAGEPAANGRRWVRASALLAQWRRKLRRSAAKGRAGAQEQEPGARQVERVARKLSRRFWRALVRTDKQLAPGQGLERGAQLAADKQEQRLDRETLDELVELVKGSLNQLIDAQLLLRNKLTNEQWSACLAPFRGAEYETLLRNNFNLLKIWQNLEETKRLACFVCEPIKANLADLFWFDRWRADWPAAQALETSVGVGEPLAGAVGQIGPAAGCQLLVTPLVCLDAIQVKRGLLQVSKRSGQVAGGGSVVQLGGHAGPAG